MKKKFFNFLAALFFALGIFTEASGIGNIPNTINLYSAEAEQFRLGRIISLSQTEDNGVVALSSGNEDNANIEIIPKCNGEAQLKVNVFGLEVKRVQVNVKGPRKVVVGGQSIGVAFYTKGALVVGASDIRDENGQIRNPAKEAGLKSGDVIERVNGIEIKDAEHVMEIINSESASGFPVRLDIIREGGRLDLEIKPVKDGADGAYRLGIWVRDSMAGVGTLSFYDPATMQFASLGHAVYDNDTNTLLRLKEGEIVESDIYGIKQGEEGMPGELKGSFDDTKPKIGSISTNNDFGIYGRLYQEPEKSEHNRIMETAAIDEIETGPAKILTTIDGDGIKEYDVYIEKLAPQEYPSTKSMVIRVTDEELLRKTGGIIQGMSGSPIIQNNKVVGAVTHVFVNNPTKGYGLYASWMLEQME
ncbi:MAG: SpoIVB peptidase [Clostridia bacterium]|nr:SpoIVB peptidase [Clostridia bacterium]